MDKQNLFINEYIFINKDFGIGKIIGFEKDKVIVSYFKDIFSLPIKDFRSRIVDKSTIFRSRKNNKILFESKFNYY